MIEVPNQFIIPIFRYALGRRTYIVDDTCILIRKLIKITSLCLNTGLMKSRDVLVEETFFSIFFDLLL